VIWIVLGLVMVIGGIYAFWRDDWIEYGGPIIGLFLAIPGGIIAFGQILYLAGVPV
jgi:uncharacterized membrane-anchored protein